MLSLTALPLFRYVAIKDKKGIKNILQTLHEKIKGSEVKGPGVIVDADDDLTSRWAAIRRILLNAAYKNIPLTPTPGGTVIQEEGLPL